MRFAIYYAPGPSSLLNQLGSQWLGRDAFAGGGCTQPTGLAEITAEPRRYGFHATLKPPFGLKEQFSPAALEVATEVLAESFQPLHFIPALRQIDGFLAIVPADPAPEIAHMAAACVRTLDGFRRPSSEAELSRRRSAGLSPRQDQNLERWGYPYVFEDFQFHMTLTRRLPPHELQQVMPMAEDHFTTVLGRPVIIDALSLFVEPRHGAPFEVHRRFPFQAVRTKALS